MEPRNTILHDTDPPSKHHSKSRRSRARDMSPKQAHTNLDKVAKIEDLGGTQVHCCGRTSGFQSGQISRAMTLVKMHGRQSFSTSFSVDGNFGGKSLERTSPKQCAAIQTPYPDPAHEQYPSLESFVLIKLSPFSTWRLGSLGLRQRKRPCMRSRSGVVREKSNRIYSPDAGPSRRHRSHSRGRHRHSPGLPGRGSNTTNRNTTTTSRSPPTLSPSFTCADGA